jgi:hypothetical protein
MRAENVMFIYDRPKQSTSADTILHIKMRCYDFFYNFVLDVYRKNLCLEKKRYYVSICSIFKNEAPYIKEWIEYHLLIGVDHFYLYNNFSDDNYLEILKPYVAAGIITLLDWPVLLGQAPAYEDCFKKHRHESKWICFLDLDEFICPRDDITVRDWVARFEKYPSVMIYWRMFGTSGKMEYDPSKLVIEQYFNCWPKLHEATKVLFNTDYDVYDFNNIHGMEAVIRIGGKRKYAEKTLVIPPINEFRKFVRYGIHRVGNHKLSDVSIQINHYWSKSYWEYAQKKAKKGEAIWKKPRFNLNYFLWHEHKNTSCDFTIWRFLAELKLRMGYECQEIPNRE